LLSSELLLDEVRIMPHWLPVQSFPERELPSELSKYMPLLELPVQSLPDRVLSLDCDNWMPYWFSEQSLFDSVPLDTSAKYMPERLALLSLHPTTEKCTSELLMDIP